MRLDAPHRDIHAILDRARHHATPTREERLRARCTVAYVATLCVRAMNRLFDGSGGQALFEARPLQRFHRDIHAASHHVSFSWDMGSRTCWLRILFWDLSQSV